MKPNTTTRLLLLAAGVAAAPYALATNGMDFAGYGPIAEAMGGASYAYDNGTAAMQNNPATLSLMESDARFDVALGFLLPTIKYSPAPGAAEQTSDGTMYLMPGLGYARREGALTFGLGVMGQGGMGTKWGTKLSNGAPYENYSNIRYGKLIVPLSYKVTDQLAVAAALNFGYADMEMKMLASGADMYWMSSPATQAALGSMMTATLIGNPQAASLDFSGGDKASATGWGVRLGATFQPSDALTLGAIYNSKSHLSAMKGKVKINMMNTGGGVDTINGDLALPNFQWPDSYGVGAALHMGDLMLTADYERINWSKTMDTFDATVSALVVNGTSMAGEMNLSMPLHWKDQNVVKLGAQYRMDSLTFRVGANLANNPVPDGYANPLLPAIYQNHVTAGLGVQLGRSDSIDFSAVYTPKVSTTHTYHQGDAGTAAAAPGSITTGTGTSSAAGGGAQIMYSHLF
ncbi:MAG: hypothetical protein COX57_03365 [Alphaproteobacteria bacterium CG_4_10_14_0_2_um_filter_63_37]|nr:MAG: hypothetical protein AUJ55_05730 [Proteobacteria bacterium CG1_02_64_396]PJA25442.1 MAG: hypothetical protein COX57_03365 [Alphaproteobacteria bacterium CG_4_10_14_0_2_um_filter_63_37]